MKVLLETDDKSVNSSGPKLNYTNKTILYLRNQMFSGWHGKMSIHNAPGPSLNDKDKYEESTKVEFSVQSIA